ncbi:hypothetical protein C7460_11468 [Marinoscillum furvescens DSM 4134]|uniref:Uncharacterized protein n=1 Tax=Marinoscillum furvescens DSM 4134 TaxID=1122208 RepID=A0A3D9L1A7_MARFU|nr:hypothetical protein C7460_11468 [Marinoscillum furvescens DSM 4134]
MQVVSHGSEESYTQQARLDKARKDVVNAKKHQFYLGNWGILTHL